MTLDTRAYKNLRQELKHAWQAQSAPCWICSQAINYHGIPGEPDSFDLDHVKPRKTHPHLNLDRNNCRPSHARCNRSRGAGRDLPQTGTTTEDW